MKVANANVLRNMEQLRVLSGIGVNYDLVNGNVDFSSNYLTTLADGPKRVIGSYLSYDNKLTTLLGAPSFVGGDFHLKCK